MSEPITVARPYAQAAFDFAVEHHNVEAWQAMLTFAALVSCEPKVQQLFASMIAPAQLADKFIAICGDQIDENGRNFIRIMAENQRLSLLPEVLTLFEGYQASYDNLAKVDVVSAQPLSDQQKNSITKAMEHRLSRKVLLHCSIDKSIMAGVIIRSGDLVIDGSVRGRLQRLANSLQS